jgi:hypothetical protein
MATGKMPADIGITHPRPRAKSCARARARYPPRAPSRARSRYPRACAARGHARVPAKPEGGASGRPSGAGEEDAGRPTDRGARGSGKAMAPRCVGWRPLQPALLREAVRDGRMAVATGGGQAADGRTAVTRLEGTVALRPSPRAAWWRWIGASALGGWGDG